MFPRSLTLATLFLTVPVLVSAQQLSSQARARQIAAAFTKHKEMVAEKHGVRKEKYKDVRSEPLVHQDITQYSGLYQVTDLGDAITLRISTDGRIEATGHDADPSRGFVLEHAAIAGAVLTATKVYRDGGTEPFEGVFLSRTERNAPSDPGITTVGLGVMLHKPREFGGNTYDKLFYQLRP